MPVPCPGCGRSYGEARFAGGRTLHCACGARVAGPPPPADPDAELRFAVDAMLGRLARWLRLLGFDAWYEEGVADERLVRRALDEQRWILTRDRALPLEWRAPRVHLVAAFGLAARARPFVRCSRCNAALVPLTAAEAAQRVPPAVRARHAGFRGCPACGRAYWEGSHVERIRRVLARLREPPAGSPA